jgi:acetyl esterase/lipase
VSNPRWAADGKGIFFAYADQGDTKLAYLSLDGSTKVLAEHLNAGGNFSIARNNSFAVQYDTPGDPGDVAVASLANPKLNVLTSLNRELFTAKKLGAVEELWYDSSFDKRKIEGWIIKPPGFDPTKKYPLILQIHGGPFSNFGDRFDLNAQIWAAKDYVILYTNPRGSTSYGEEFANLIHHAYPGNDFQDLDSGVDAILSKGYIDKDNLFVTGGSGGGVLTCWMIGHTDRFRAAASLYPVINWYSWVLTSDLPAFGSAILVLRQSLGLRRRLYEALGNFFGEKCENAYFADDRRGRLPHSHIRSRAILRSPQTPESGIRARPLPGRAPRPQPPPEPSRSPRSSTPSTGSTRTTRNLDRVLAQLRSSESYPAAALGGAFC